VSYPKTVLIIDEVYFYRQTIKNMLLGCSVTVYEAISLSEGLELFEKITPSVIIIGASFANDNGLYFARNIKKQHVEVKIIFIFNNADKDAVCNVFLAGGNVLLVLPLKKERLLNEILLYADTRSYSNTINFFARKASMAFT